MIYLRRAQVLSQFSQLARGLGPNGVQRGTTGTSLGQQKRETKRENGKTGNREKSEQLWHYGQD